MFILALLVILPAAVVTAAPFRAFFGVGGAVVLAVASAAGLAGVFVWLGKPPKAYGSDPRRRRAWFLAGVVCWTAILLTKSVSWVTWLRQLRRDGWLDWMPDNLIAH